MEGYLNGEPSIDFSNTGEFLKHILFLKNLEPNHIQGHQVPKNLFYLYHYIYNDMLDMKIYD